METKEFEALAADVAGIAALSLVMGFITNEIEKGRLSTDDLSRLAERAQATAEQPRFGPNGRSASAIIDAVLSAVKTALEDSRKTREPYGY